jgi:hypothetical protein
MEIIALQNELSPNCMVLIFGKPHEEQNAWRLDALKEINRSMLDNPDFSSESLTLSTFDYISNIHELGRIYGDYKYTHKVLLSPTGSKLQAIADFVFRQIHPDVQIVYPMTESFKGEYSSGCKALWSIRINDFSSFVSKLDQIRRLETKHNTQMSSEIVLES